MADVSRSVEWTENINNLIPRCALCVPVTQGWTNSFHSKILRYILDQLKKVIYVYIGHGYSKLQPDFHMRM